MVRTRWKDIPLGTEPQFATSAPMSGTARASAKGICGTRIQAEPSSPHQTNCSIGRPMACLPSSIYRCIWYCAPLLLGFGCQAAWLLGIVEDECDTFFSPTRTCEEEQVRSRSAARAMSLMQARLLYFDCTLRPPTKENAMLWLKHSIFKLLKYYSRIRSGYRCLAIVALKENFGGRNTWNL